MKFLSIKLDFMSGVNANVIIIYISNQHRSDINFHNSNILYIEYTGWIFLKIILDRGMILGGWACKSAYCISFITTFTKLTNF